MASAEKAFESRAGTRLVLHHENAGLLDVLVRHRVLRRLAPPAPRRRSCAAMQKISVRALSVSGSKRPVPLASRVLGTPSMSTVSSIMTRKVLTVAAGADLKDAAWGLTLKGFSGAPVKDESGHVIGILSKSDL